MTIMSIACVRAPPTRRADAATVSAANAAAMSTVGKVLR
jgi:hypothetical protein